ncbi:hypothetical protein KUW17_15110 [Leisingera aquaemixtae]|uniref:hypothetical protein n=1 Tax=Leisingera TaxID=191028 RepID=UPI001C95DDBD|nr:MULTISPECIES: hypothetical protein [Leisingera]MBY6068083.1 hypothetical protein [Leisingera aquaemixtae]MCB4456341.1 hypothetical protein [Leisingera sp. McT4-56]
MARSSDFFDLNQESDGLTLGCLFICTPEYDFKLRQRQRGRCVLWNQVIPLHFVLPQEQCDQPIRTEHEKRFDAFGPFRRPFEPSSHGARRPENHW